MNPCPCGYSGHPKIQCQDSPQQIAQYRRKLSGPLLDRFDIHVEVTFQNAALLLDHDVCMESSAEVFQRVAGARKRQLVRQGKLNNQLDPTELRRWCAIPDQARSVLERAMDTLSLSGRAAHRILRVARTLADLMECEDIRNEHVLQALAYRGIQGG
jgi:magnesium chelatase family protein